MNAKPTPVTSDLGATKTMLDGIANSFFLLNASIGKPSMVCQVPDSIKKQIIATLAEKGEEGFANFSIPLFGAFHKKFLEMVVAPRAAIWTFLDANTVKFAPETSGQRTGPRLIPVERFTEIDSGIQAIVDKANESFEAFLEDYEEYCAAGIENANSTFAGYGLGHIFKAAGKWPGRDKFRRQFYIDISDPEPLAVMDISRYKGASIPVGRMASIAASNMKKLEASLEGAKQEAIENARLLAELVAKQLGTEKRFNSQGKPIESRLSESLISKAKSVSAVLNGVMSGYGHDDQIKAAADLLADKVGSVESTDVWKNSESARLEAFRAATAAAKILAKKPAKAAKPAGVQAGDEVIGGFLDD